MTGPEHYREAEQYLAALDETVQSDKAVAWSIAQAQVHATLAVAAATAYPAVKDYVGDEAAGHAGDWLRAVS